MKITSMIAIYFIMWWTVLFAVLPFSVKNAAETGESVEGGNDAGAPVAHQMGRKAVLTTVISAGLFAVLYALIVSGVLERFDWSFMPSI
jgi:predicted secreted protein